MPHDWWYSVRAPRPRCVPPHSPGATPRPVFVLLRLLLLLLSLSLLLLPALFVVAELSLILHLTNHALAAVPHPVAVYPPQEHVAGDHQVCAFPRLMDRE